MAAQREPISFSSDEDYASSVSNTGSSQPFGFYLLQHISRLSGKEGTEDTAQGDERRGAEQEETDPLTGRTGATVPASFLPSTGTKTLADSHLRFIPLLPQLLLFIALWKTNTSFLVSEIRDENHQQFLSTYRSIFDKRGHAHPFSMN